MDFNKITKKLRKHDDEQRGCPANLFVWYHLEVFFSRFICIIRTVIQPNTGRAGFGKQGVAGWVMGLK